MSVLFNTIDGAQRPAREKIGAEDIYSVPRWILFVSAVLLWLSL